MSSPGVAAGAAAPVSSARAEASRRNGAKSRGPKTLEGKARSAQNALKHGLRAQKYVVPPDENAAELRGLETALIDGLAPQGVLQSILIGRIARAAWPKLPVLRCGPPSLPSWRLRQSTGLPLAMRAQSNPKSCGNPRESASSDDPANPSGSDPGPAPVRPRPTPGPRRPAVQLGWASPGTPRPQLPAAIPLRHPAASARSRRGTSRRL
jgi:hypothetical protein